MLLCGLFTIWTLGVDLGYNDIGFKGEVFCNGFPDWGKGLAIYEPLA